MNAGNDRRTPSKQTPNDAAVADRRFERQAEGKFYQSTRESPYAMLRIRCMRPTSGKDG
jgi:hypothetical protein